ncbi:Pycsar system effector family protein [Qipengyuania sp. MTN3-11]|uniref:Pycsar system effector family protein n=1 Tax=Qipengyuania sp. MTN3-11 TaxID=3056557 RepID=UPI0036F2FA8D
MVENADIAGETPEPRRFAGNAVQMLRTVQANTQALSQMADQKASILMGATFVVFSISVSRAVAGDIEWSLTILAFFAFMSSLCAVIAILPSIGSLRKAKPPPPNRLFFGYFTTRDEDEWAEEVLQRMETEEAMFRMMLRDIYQNGQVLQRKKYRFLTFAYRMFIFGLCLTTVAFIFERFVLGV